MTEEDNRYYEVWLNDRTVVKVRDLTDASLQKVLDATPVKLVKDKTKVAIMALFRRAIRIGRFELKDGGM